MFSLAPVVLLLTAAGVSALPAASSPRQTSTTDCADVHVFLARGTGEDYPGRQINVVNAICDRVLAAGGATCDYEDIAYPASFTNPEYCGSVAEGVSGGTAQLTAYAARCPDAQLVVSGYSQGAQVAGNILGGQDGGSTGCTEVTGTGLDATTAPGSQIKAVAFFGDVTHVANQTYNVESGSAKNGIYPRTGTQLERLNAGYSDVLQSWCVAEDPVCAQGNNGEAHTTYFDIFSEATGEWVLSQLTL